jgi:Fe2+ or Zn2+ uptake regulation protein
MPRISLATVYKALEALVDTGVAAKLPPVDADSGARYDARRDPHYHFRCLRTGTVHDLPTRFDPDLIAKLDPELVEDLDRRGFRVTGYRLELLGYRAGGRGA